MDSGIKIERESQGQLELMKEVKKNPFDYIIMQIKEIEGAPAPTGKKSAPEHVIIVEKVDKGECEKKYQEEGVDTEGVPANYYAVHQYFKAHENECCIAILYLHYELPAQGPQDKLIAINWCPDSSSMKLKMRYSSTFKTVCQKAPKLNGKVEAHDMDDVKYKSVVSEISNKK